MKDNNQITGAEIIVDALEACEIEYIFGIPGSKIDGVFDQLSEKGPKLILTRHEQNAAFMAAAIGRISGKPGVTLATSGPGATNNLTGLLTAQSESDPVIAILGQVKTADLSKLVQQNTDNTKILSNVCKYGEEVYSHRNIATTIQTAYRESVTGRPGATFVSFPQDIVENKVEPVAISKMNVSDFGPGNLNDIKKLVSKIKTAKLPVIFAGMRSSSSENVEIIREIVRKTNIPVVETFQGAGVISRDLIDNFYGRVGFSDNQPGDKLLRESDLIITIGYDQIEYKTEIWNSDKKKNIVNIDAIPTKLNEYFEPEFEILGNISCTLEYLNEQLVDYHLTDNQEFLQEIRNQLDHTKMNYERLVDRIHPLDVVQKLQELVTDEMTVTVDIGSVYLWMSRYFRSYEPRRLLFSNGMQTLGVALPWAIATSLVRKNEKVISVSGDGGFLFSSNELVTAVKENANILHIVWNDESYNMVGFQAEIKYNRTSGIQLGGIDIIKHAESFGAKGYRVTNYDDFETTIEAAFNENGVVVLEIPIDYKDNLDLAKVGK